MASSTSRSFVSREEFCRLLLSRNELIRISDSSDDGRVIGLQDVKSGRVYVIEEDLLFDDSDCRCASQLNLSALDE